MPLPVVLYTIPQVFVNLYQLTPLRRRMRAKGLSERVVAEHAGIARSTVRAVAARASTVELKSLASVAEATGSAVVVMFVPEVWQADCSTVAVSYKVLRDGDASWKIHFMDLVDEFRRSLDPSLLLLPPPTGLRPELRALLAGIVLTLAQEADMDAPPWARKRHELPRPWFVSETESLKAMALLESPLAFRRNGIFVTNNFLSRA